jgi:dephospho-CoA kinase
MGGSAMLVVAITGGIGSGKSRVTRLFRQHGTPYIDADKVARELSSQAGKAYPAICSHFGKTILESNGEINRPKLRKIVFSQPEKRLWLEKLLHPMINQEIEQRLKQLDAPYCTVEIPLLAETGRKAWMDRVLVVDAPKKIRIERIKKRDSLKDAEIKAIFSTQATRKKRLSMADDVIENTGELKDLATQVKKIHNYYLLLAEKKALKNA